MPVTAALKPVAALVLPDGSVVTADDGVDGLADDEALRARARRRRQGDGRGQRDASQQLGVAIHYGWTPLVSPASQHVGCLRCLCN